MRGAEIDVDENAPSVVIEPCPRRLQARFDGAELRPGLTAIAAAHLPAMLTGMSRMVRMKRLPDSVLGMCGASSPQAGRLRRPAAVTAATGDEVSEGTIGWILPMHDFSNCFFGLARMRTLSAPMSIYGSADGYEKKSAKLLL